MFKSGDSVDTFEIMEKAPEGIRKIFPKKIARISFSTWDFLCKSTIYDNELISKEDLERLVFSEDSRKKREQIILNTHTTI